MAQETLEESYLNKLIDEANQEFTLDRKLAKEVAIKFSKWKQDRIYSEDDMIEFGKFCHKDANSVNRLTTFKELFEQFKKK